ncbi:MAG: hypothetical protein AAB320_10670 [Elusimicrobiota bacterium]
MKKILLSCALAFCLAAPSAADDQALGNLLDARGSFSAASLVFDGGRFLPASTALPVFAGPGGFKRLPAAAAITENNGNTARPDTAQGDSAQGISGGYLGLYPESDFELGTGRCEACRAPREGKWYFLDDVIATPKSGPAGLVWLGSPEMVEGATLSEDGRAVTLKDGTSLPFDLTPKIESNRSYFDASSLAYMRGRTVRIRGQFVTIGGERRLVARTVWPEDYRIDAANLKEGDAKNSQDIDMLVASDKGGAKKPFMTRLLWEREKSREWEGKPVMGFMLNGAQGDDDEALAGHFSMFTGRYGANGSMADWMFNNFYDMNSTSEKGIIASMVPMDKYMADLNSGQSWYRPTTMLVMVMKDARVPLQYQEMFKQRYARYYDQTVKYDRTNLNCTGLIADPVRGEGWKYPEVGKTPKLIARAISKLVSAVGKDPEAGEQIYRSLREEPTRSFPRQSFNSVGGDLLSLAGSFGAEPLGRELTAMERMIQEDLEAIIFVRLPQIPSSRAFGRDPAGSVTDYFMRTPMDRSKWQTVPTVPRPFPPPLN